MSTPPIPTIAPATGPVVTIRQTATFRLVAGPKWYIYDNNSTTVIVKTLDLIKGTKGIEGFIGLEASEFPQISSDLTVMAQTARNLEQRRWKSPVRITEYRTIAGVKGFVLQSSDSEKQFYEWGGLDANNVLTVLAFKIPTGAGLDKWVEPTLASIEWK
ncbi:hypothetical protein [Psychromicrobium lacuslunae]|uniref:hypothetical protein n=1 Tax=Psychromicrobium lacuslunae TaxID=1618207 RepID=UPI0012FEE532|nr:hypothetical protein [Psychromicrobium lacuslunae]